MTPPQLVTLQKKDPRFQSYLRRSAPRGQQISIVQSLNPTRANELVTFAIRDRRVSYAEYVWAVAEVLKLPFLLYILAPLILVRAKQIRDQTAEADLRFLWVTLFAIFFFEATALLVEYREHIQGIDRILGSSFQKPLQRGIFSASTLRKWGILFLTLAFVLAIYLLIHLTVSGLIIAGASLFCALLWLNPIFRSKHTYWAEASSYLLFGPLLFIGIQVGSNAPLDLEIIVMGLAFGLLPLWNFYLKNFSYIFLQEHEYFKNSIFRRGFDQSKIFLMRFWLVLIAAFLAFQYIYQGQKVFTFDLVVSVVVAFVVLLPIRNLQSPLGSQMGRAIRSGRIGSAAVLILWILEQILPWT